MKKFLLVFLCLIIIGTSLLSSDGYLCFENLRASVICKCNHGSEKEKHSTIDDGILFSEHKIDYAMEKLPNCHTTKKGKTHLCSCKNTSNNLSTFLFQKSTLFMLILFERDLLLLKENTHYTSYLLIASEGFHFLITPPPKIS